MINNKNTIIYFILEEGIYTSHNSEKTPLYLVTGGAGFIGSNVSSELVARGFRVRIFDNFSTGRESNLEEIKDKIELIRGDLTVFPEVEEAVKGVDVILHLGALGSVPRSINNPIASHHANVSGTLNILTAAKDNGVKRVVYSSSSSVYGDTEVLPKVETMAPNPRSPYAVTKMAAEYNCRVFYQIYGLETVCLRYFNIFGPRQNPNNQYAAVVPKFIKALISGGQPEIFGDGGQSRDFTFVENAVNANLLAATAKNAEGKVFNIACNTRVTVNYMAKKIGEYLGKEVNPTYRETRQGDVRHSLADIEQAKAILGYKPAVGIDEGLHRTVEWYKKREYEGL
ncbi:MAG: SDR family oxidoreductase [Firmicutes bacterium]|nr:SDR family oxidoreductase [Bacillota bacterium]